MKNTDKPAYPAVNESNIDGRSFYEPGLTKRDAFAMAAMQGIIAGFDMQSKCNGCYIPFSEYPMLMQQAVQMADELLKQLES